MATAGVLISRIPDIDDLIFEKLKWFGFRSIESFLSIVMRDSYYKQEFTKILGLSPGQVSNLISSAKKGLAVAKPSHYTVPSRSKRKYPLGAAVPRKPNRRSPKSIPVGAPRKYPKSADLRTIMTPVKDQGARGTCVAFSLLAAREAMEKNINKQTIDLSEQCLYYHCKERDDYVGDGTWLIEGIKALKNNGVCKEDYWKYKKDFKKNDIQRLPKPKNCKSYPCKGPRTHFKINDYCELMNDTDVKKSLNKNMPVVTAIPVYRSWYEDGWVESTGEIGNPLPSDLADSKNLFGYHAICFTGYDENDMEFYFKNSWGSYWAKNSTYSPGYGTLPYDYFNNHALESYYVGI